MISLSEEEFESIVRWTCTGMPEDKRDEQVRTFIRFVERPGIAVSLALGSIFTTCVQAERDQGLGTKDLLQMMARLAFALGVRVGYNVAVLKGIE